MIFKKIAILISLFAGSFILSAQLNTDRIMNIGRNALYFEDYVLSIQYFNQVIKIKPYMAEPYMYRAIAKTQLGDYTGAEKDCNAAIDRNPFLPGVYYIRGFILRSTGHYKEAEKDFTRALEFSPENKTYLINRADVRERQQKYETAQEDILYLLRREPQAADLYFELGRIQLSNADTLAATLSFSQVIKYAPYESAGWSARALAYMLQDKQEEALADLDKAIELGSEWAGDYANRGVLHYKRHNYRNALADYDQAIRLAPNNLQCYYNRGTLRQELGDYNNALVDFERVLELDPTCMEGRYQHGIVSLELHQWHDAKIDFDTIINMHPYFLPAYYLAAQAEQAMGNTKEAFVYRKRAYDLEENKDEIQRHAKQATLNTDVKIAGNHPPTKDRRKEFSSRAAQDIAETTTEYDSHIRGNIQKQYVNIVNEPNFALTYYAKPNTLRRTNYYHPAIEELIHAIRLSANLKITNQEIALNATLISTHFDAINSLSDRIAIDPENAWLYFARAIEFSIVQDYTGAIEDLNRATALNTQMALAYFCRANLRYKQLEYNSNQNETQTLPAIGQPSSTSVLSSENRYKLDFELIIRDYDRTIDLLPSFAFAYYNKANVLCTQKEYTEAIKWYEQAIKIDSEFAEAYFNLGLTQVFINRLQKGMDNLGKAGELGIYQAYNILSRFQE